MGRDKYGNYVNEKGVVIKINTDKHGNDHISFYDGEVDGDHSAVHVNVDYDKENWSSKYHNEDRSDDSPPSSGGCYLTTACMNHFQEAFDDDCEELTILRRFRDTFVPKEDVEHYYRVAPKIVDTINKSPDQDSIYTGIYENVIAVCVDAIKNGNFEYAYNLYKKSVLSLEMQFVQP